MITELRISNGSPIKKTSTIQEKTGLVPKSCSTKVRIVETGELFDSEAECARAIGGHYKNISSCLHGWQKTHLGYHFERG